MEDARDSLADRMAQRFAAREVRAEPRSPGPVNWRLAAALAGMIALGPLTTIVGAGVIEHGARAEAARLQTQAAPRLNAEERERAVRAALRTAARDAGVAVWLDRVAVAIPAEARVARMVKAADGAFELEISTPDPDLLRGALRADPALAGFRETGQRRAGAMIAVTLRYAK
ncbi:hypothetical protein OK349_00120 [Sphingomonas sp. BT-65]|uniref:hypothetical protein n=1 Tax=Sphingomonas sp. BT-65 TaxID=2989821 RepID=UPI002235B5DD|nr:hypothetical protein [Sphingomonas sp. BT-65]MCW4460099.1 hypothetical protein [Sphingomonas sp. BT-65]